jgi:hypothetical protein
MVQFCLKIIEKLNEAHMREKCIYLVILIFYMASSLAQEAVIPAGGDATGSGGSSAYTVGQILYTSSSNATAGLILGVQQPYEISVVNGLDRFEAIALSLSTYPNPVTDLLILKAENLKWNDLNFQMYNSEGKMFLTEKLVDTETSIDMSRFAPGIYFLRVNMDRDAVKTFKIIKK